MLFLKYYMGNEKFEKGKEPEISKKAGERKVLVIERALSGLRFSQKDIEIILKKLNQLHLEGKVQTLKEALEIAPTLDISELNLENKDDKINCHVRKR